MDKCARFLVRLAILVGLSIKVLATLVADGFCVRGTNIWGPNVAEFIEAHLK